MLLQEELPILHAAFQRCGLHPGHVLAYWHRECCVSSMGMSDVVCYVTMGLILGADWLLYFMLAVLQQRQGTIREHLARVGMADAFLLRGVSFDIQAAVPYMQLLHLRWSETLTPLLVNPADT